MASLSLHYLLLKNDVSQELDVCFYGTWSLLQIVNEK